MSASPSPTIKILTVTCVAHALTHIFTILHTPILRTIGLDFELELESIAIYFTLLNACFGLGSIPAGWLSDRFGEKILLAAFYFGCALGSGLIGLAPDRLTLGAGCVILGLATSIYHPVGSALISKGIERRGFAMGINGIAGSVGTALGPLLASLIFDLSGWRWAYLGIALPTIFIGLGFLALDLGPAARPRQRPRGTSSGKSPLRLDRKVVIFALLLLAMTCGGFYYHLVTTTFPLHLRFPGQDGNDAGGYATALVLTFGIIWQLIAGVLADRTDKLRIYVINYVLIVPSVWALGQLSGLPLLILASISSIFFFFVQPIENALIADYTPANWRGLVYGLKFVLVFAVGGLGTWAAASILERASIPAVFTLTTAVAGLAFVSALAGLALRRKGPELPR